MDVMVGCMWPPCMGPPMAIPMGGLGPPGKWPWAMDVLAVDVGAPEEPGVWGEAMRGEAIMGEVMEGGTVAPEDTWPGVAMAVPSGAMVSWHRRSRMQGNSEISLGPTTVLAMMSFTVCRGGKG